MTAIQPATAATVQPKSIDAAASANSAEDVATRFLTLLVSQMRNQDPLNPLDNAEVTSQLAQLSTVSGISQLNDTVAGLVSSFAANQYLQSAGLIGHDVLVQGNNLELADGSAAGGFALDSAAERVVATLKDATGKVVRQIDLGTLPPGIHQFTWNGMNDSGASASAGQYTVSVSATSGTTTTNIEPLVSGRVTGVSPGANGAQVQVAGVGPVDLSSIWQVS